ncbi:MAG: AAA family ATPase, partial [Nitrosopumilus sp.]|nr:AAA family ATPase [Nitrosopumilus sp.]
MNSNDFFQLNPRKVSPSRFPGNCCICQTHLSSGETIWWARDNLKRTNTSPKPRSLIACIKHHDDITKTTLSNTRNFTNSINSQKDLLNFRTYRISEQNDLEFLKDVQTDSNLDSWLQKIIQSTSMKSNHQDEIKYWKKTAGIFFNYEPHTGNLRIALAGIIDKTANYEFKFRKGWRRPTEDNTVTELVMKHIQPSNENWRSDFKSDLNSISFENFMEYLNLADGGTTERIPQSEMDELSEETIQEAKKDVKDENKPEVTKTNNENLKLLDSETLQKGIDEIYKDGLLIDKEVIYQIVTNLCAGRHILLAGPIGTGKSHLARLIPKVFWNKETELFTATYEWGTTDVVGGLMPDKTGRGYIHKDGCVPKTIKENNWAIIDEFNRADIDKAMGKLFSSLVNGKISNEDGEPPLDIPKDYRIIATMNTADKFYLNKMSSALLRRFAYIEVNTPKNEITEYFVALNEAVKKLEFTDEKISQIIDMDILRKTLQIRIMNGNDNAGDDGIKNDNVEKKFLTALNIFQFIRNEKKLGTAVLVSIFQTMITRLLFEIPSEMENVLNESLDFALVSNLMPQLWDSNPAFLETLKAFATENIAVFFMNKQKEFKNLQMVSKITQFTKQLDNIISTNYLSFDHGDKNLTEQTINELLESFKNGKELDQTKLEDMRSYIQIDINLP